MAQKEQQKNLLIHAGNLKTGSTSIQKFLRTNLTKINGSGRIIVPCIENNPASHANLCRELKINDAPPGPYPLWNDIAEVASSSQMADVLLTNEIFIRVPPERLKQAIDSNLALKPTFFFYVRPHIGMFVSNYMQEAKTGFCRERIDEVYDNFFSRSELRFTEAIREYARVFGQDAVKVREYNRQKLVDEDVVSDFVDFLGADWMKQFLGRGEKDANISPGLETIALLLHTRQHLPIKIGIERYLELRDRIFIPLNKSLTDALGREYRTKLLPSVATQEKIKERFDVKRRDFANDGFISDPSENWQFEPITAPKDPTNPPYELVMNAFKSVILKASAAGDHSTSSLLKRVVENLPTSVQGGVSVVVTDTLKPRI